MIRFTPLSLLLAAGFGNAIAHHNAGFAVLCLVLIALGMLWRAA